MDASEIIRRREALGLTRPQLAAEIGVDHVTLWRWERDKPTTSAVMERALCATLERLEAEQQPTEAVS